MPSSHWSHARPQILVVACSDGRLQEATDRFLSHELAIARYDRFYVPGGGGALASSGRDFLRAHRLRQECRYLIELHQVTDVLLLFHGPAADGPRDAVCADYRRKLAWATPANIIERQERDAAELLAGSDRWARGASVTAYLCQVHSDYAISFRSMGP